MTQVCLLELWRNLVVVSKVIRGIIIGRRTILNFVRGVLQFLFLYFVRFCIVCNRILTDDLLDLPFLLAACVCLSEAAASKSMYISCSGVF